MGTNEMTKKNHQKESKRFGKTCGIDAWGRWVKKAPKQIVWNRPDGIVKETAGNGEKGL